MYGTKSRIKNNKAKSVVVVNSKNLSSLKSSSSSGTSGSSSGSSADTKLTCAFTSIVSNETKKVTLTWNEVEGAAKYEIRCRRSTVSSSGSLSKVTGTTTTLKLAYGSTDYVFRIRAVDANGNALTSWTSWSDPVKIN